MNREEKRADEKKLSKEGKEYIDVSVLPPMAPDGVQFRIYATIKQDGKDVNVSQAVVCVPLIYDPPDSDKPGFIMKFGDIEKKVIGMDYRECLLMDIATNPKLRKLGFATMLMEGVKTYFDRIVTGARSEEGKSLMERCGFKNIEGQLIWRKDVEDAKGNGEKTDLPPVLK